MLNFVASPTGQAFLDSKAFIRCMMGPVGGGKSSVALMGLLHMAVEQAPFNKLRRTKFIVLRNTMQQLKSTVKPLIDQWFGTLTGGTMGQWRLTDNTFEMKFNLNDGTWVHSELILVAADTPDDVRRLLSLEASSAWVEECREVDEEVFSGLQGRVNRFPNKLAGGVTHPGIVCSTNPPPVGGFWHRMLSSPPGNTEVFIQPAAILEDGSLNPERENRENLADEYYDNLIAGKSEDWVNVYLRNQYGAGDQGQPVYRGTFRKSFHVSKVPLNAIPQSQNPLIVGMDNGLTAAATIGQMDMRGRINILGEAYVPEGETMGVETFLDRILIPLLRGKFPAFRAENIVFVVDPACFARSQVDERTIAQAIMHRGYSPVRASTNDPERRISAVEGLLARQIDGAAGFLIDPICQHTIDTLEWGFRYKKSAAGLVAAMVEKNHWSHSGDSVQYLALHYNIQVDGALYRRATKAQVVARSPYAYA